MTPHRAVYPYDWQALRDLIARAFAGMEGRIDPPSSLHRLTAQDIATQAIEGEVWVIGAPAVACVLLTPLPHALYLGKLAVDPAHHRKGHARALIALAESRARQLGLPALELSARIELVENHCTFKALGFVQTACTAHAGFDCPTTLVFTKMLLQTTQSKGRSCPT